MDSLPGEYRQASGHDHTKKLPGSQLRLFEKGDGRRHWIPRAELLEHVFGDEGRLCCRHCGCGRLEVVAVVTRWDAIRSVLGSLGLGPDGRTLVHNRGPPGPGQL